MFNILAFFALIFSVTNLVYISVLPVIFFPILPFIFYKKDLILNKHIFFLCILFLYVILSTFLYDYNSFFDFDFYRRDGNIFITYSLFIVLYTLGCTKDPREGIKYSLIVMAFISFIAFFLGKKDGATHFFLFQAHNAAGGFYGVMTAITIGLYYINKSKIYLILALVFFCFLNFTDSRGTVLAVILGFLYLLFRFRYPLVVFFSLLISQLLIVAWTYPMWVQTGKHMSEEANFDGNVSINVERGGTILDRILYLWPRAIDNFLHSPIFGTGFGSYDDLGYHYLKIVPFFSIKYGQDIRHTDAHAHNSFLTILAELGIVGFSLFFLFFYYIYKEIEKVEFWAKDLSLALKFAFWVCIFSSATEHRLTTPSQMIPFLIILALALAYNRHLNLRSRVY